MYWFLSHTHVIITCCETAFHLTFHTTYIWWNANSVQNETRDKRIQWFCSEFYIFCILLPDFFRICRNVYKKTNIFLLVEQSYRRLKGTLNHKRYEDYFDILIIQHRHNYIGMREKNGLMNVFHDLKWVFMNS